METASDLPDVSHLAPTLAIDTNVMLDIYTPTHLMEAYDKIGDNDPDHPFLIYRRARAREAILLAIHLHRAGITSYSLLDENSKKMLELAPPAQLGEFPTHYAIVMIHHIRESLLRDWEAIGPCNDPEAPTGDKADQALVDYAEKHGVPLITYEGYTPDGISDRNKKGMRARAKLKGVQVLTPSEFYADQFDQELAISKFLDGFDFIAPRIVRDSGTPEAMARAIPYVRGYFGHVLRGETPDGPWVRVTMGGKASGHR